MKAIYTKTTKYDCGPNSIIQWIVNIWELDFSQIYSRISVSFRSGNNWSLQQLSVIKDHGTKIDKLLIMEIVKIKTMGSAEFLIPETLIMRLLRSKPQDHDIVRDQNHGITGFFGQGSLNHYVQIMGSWYVPFLRSQHHFVILLQIIRSHSDHEIINDLI